MIVSKKSGDKCRGNDIDGDGVPDLPLRYEFPNPEQDSMNVVQFPLGFCPGSPETNFVVPGGNSIAFCAPNMALTSDRKPARSHFYNCAHKKSMLCEF